MEKKNKGYIIAIVCLMICVIILVGYLFYDRSLNKEKTKNCNNKCNIKQNVEVINDKPCNNESDVDVSFPEDFYDTEYNKLGKELLDKYSLKYGDGLYYFYSLDWYDSNMIDQSNFDYYLAATFEHFDKSKINWLYKDSDFDPDKFQEKCLHWIDEEHYEYECYYMTIKKADFDKAYKDLFGETIDYSDYYEEDTDHFYLDIYYDCVVRGDEIKCGYVIAGDGDGDMDFVRFSSARMNEDEDVLEVVADYVRTSSDYFNYSLNITDKDINRLFKDKKEDMGKLLIKFEKYDDGKYYWVSTEKFVTE